MKQITYIKTGDYYIPDLKLPEEHRPIGRWGRMHKDYLKEYHPVIFNQLVLSGNLWTYLVDINEQAQRRLDVLTMQAVISESVNEAMKEISPMEWARKMIDIRGRGEEIEQSELIYGESLMGESIWLPIVFCLQTVALSSVNGLIY